MPYIQIKAWPKDEAVKKEVASEIVKLFEEKWGCPKEALTVSFEEIAPADWEEKVEKPVIEPNSENMYILSGKPVK